MTDILRRLREPPFGTETSERNIMAQAADEIDRLRVLVERAYGEGVLDVFTRNTNIEAAPTAWATSDSKAAMEDAEFHREEFPDDFMEKE